MILMGMGDEDAEKVVALLLDEAEIRIDEIDARKVLLAAKTHAAIDENPLPVCFRAKAVERSVHADFAESSKGKKDQFVLVGSHSVQNLFVPASGLAISCSKLGK